MPQNTINILESLYKPTQYTVHTHFSTPHQAPTFYDTKQVKIDNWNENNKRHNTKKKKSL